MKTSGSAMAFTLIPVIFSGSLFAQSECAPEKDRSTIGYSTVAETLKVLRSTGGVTFNAAKDGWTNASDEINNAVWSFAPADHPAYPAVVKRVIHEKDGARYIDTALLCESTESACGQLKKDFEARDGLFLKGLAQFYEQNPQTDPSK